MLIGQLSTRSGVTPRALRYYEDAGLLTCERQPNGYRSYPEDAVRQVAHIRALLDAGFNTETIAMVLPCVTGEQTRVDLCPQVAAEIGAVLARIDDKLGVLQTQREQVANFLHG